MSKLPKRITKRYAKTKFNTVGLCLSTYALLILFVPLIFRKYLEVYHPYILATPFLYLDICLLMIVLFTIFPFLIIRKSFEISFANIFRRTKMSLKEIQDEAIIFFLVSSFAIFISTSIASAIGKGGSLVYTIGSFKMEEYYNHFLYPIIFVLIVPVIEEYAFRGVLQKSLSRFGKYFALIVSSLIYSLAHGSVAEFIPSFVIAYYLGKISLISGSIRPCILIHMSFNLLLYLVSIIPNRYSLYVVIFLAVLYIAGIIKLLRFKHSTISFKYKKESFYIFKIFFLSFSVIISLILFIAHTVINFLL